ncbi:MAG: hypothetical protein B6D46_02985 [Polyangiaceae bacterium UTPRO1]|jgi:arylsulfatase A-like enzyme|nr:sulfatase [Myxococcales bacterium]OQY68626.1 MAG: hypothetical protein B6D46_02985 [Polyangiaceae bacterium UTPRO1]
MLRPYLIRGGSLAAAFLLVISGTGCERSSAPTRVPYARLVDFTKPPGDAAIPHGAMGDEMRHVLVLRQGHVRPGAIERSFDSVSIPIPAGAELDFALGAATAPEGDRTVTFEIGACDEAACETIFTERVDFAAAGVEAWMDRHVALDRFAGTDRRLTFRVVVATASTLPYFANPTLWVRTPEPKFSRNVVLVSLDTLRASRLGSYGYRHDTAPFIDATFARGGTLFEACVAAATNTTASHMTMFTSLPPSVHAVGIDPLLPLPPWMATLPERFRAEGFTTGAITEDGWVAAALGFGRGFDTYAENKSPDIMEPRGQADVTFAGAGEWLRRHRDERFFLFVHTYQVHSPYVPPAEYGALFTAQPDVPPAAAVDAANYDREIRFTDDMLQRLVAAIRDLGLADRTIVIVTADHGEEFLEHGCLWHGPDLYEEVTHVPLMLRGPGIPAGLRIPEPVGLIDLLPTLLDLAGIAVPPEAMGRSLVPALQRRHADPDRELSTEAWMNAECGGRSYAMPGFALRVGNRKMARYRRAGSFAYELYDIATDPRERSDRRAADAREAADLQARIDGYENDCRERREALRVRAGAPATANKPVAIDARQREKLRALGYAE